MKGIGQLLLYSASVWVFRSAQHDMIFCNMKSFLHTCFQFSYGKYQFHMNTFFPIKCCLSINNKNTTHPKNIVISSWENVWFSLKKITCWPVSSINNIVTITQLPYFWRNSHLFWASYRLEASLLNYEVELNMRHLLQIGGINSQIIWIFGQILKFPSLKDPTSGSRAGIKLNFF